MNSLTAIYKFFKCKYHHKLFLRIVCYLTSNNKSYIYNHILSIKSKYSKDYDKKIGIMLNKLIQSY